MKSARMVEAQPTWMFFISDLKTDVKKVAEQVHTLEKSYAELASRIEVITVRQENLIQKMDDLFEKLDVLSPKIDSLKTAETIQKTTVKNVRWLSKPATWCCILAFAIFMNYTSAADRSQNHDERIQRLESALQKASESALQKEPE